MYRAVVSSASSQFMPSEEEIQLFANGFLDGTGEQYEQFRAVLLQITGRTE